MTIDPVANAAAVREKCKAAGAPHAADALIAKGYDADDLTPGMIAAAVWDKAVDKVNARFPASPE
ncbi:MAG: hypothetical protein ABJP67_14475 [Nitratireductor sp.]|uniref:hypothetical protein n=1 Tax=Bauldia litoralis TaxID=665467 RepID=UPI0032638937